MAPKIAKQADGIQFRFGSDSAKRQLFRSRFYFEQAVLVDDISGAQIPQPEPIQPLVSAPDKLKSTLLQGISSRFSKKSGQFDEYQNEYQNDTKGCIPIDADTRSSSTKPQKNLNQTEQKCPIPTLASALPRVHASRQRGGRKIEAGT